MLTAAAPTLIYIRSTTTSTLSGVVYSVQLVLQPVQCAPPVLRNPSPFTPVSPLGSVFFPLLNTTFVLDSPSLPGRIIAIPANGADSYIVPWGTLSPLPSTFTGITIDPRQSVLFLTDAAPANAGRILAIPIFAPNSSYWVIGGVGSVHSGFTSSMNDLRSPSFDPATNSGDFINPVSFQLWKCPLFNPLATTTLSISGSVQASRSWAPSIHGARTTSC